MTRTVGRYVAPEMAALWFAELVLAFVVVYATIGTAPDPGMLGHTWSAVDFRVVPLALTFGLLALAIGLYRPEICLDPRRVALNGALVAVLAFPIALAVGGAVNGGLSATYAMWLVKALALWIACVLVTRWALRLLRPQALLARRVLVVGAGASASRLIGAVRGCRGAMFEFAGSLDPRTDLPSVGSLRSQRIWALLVSEDAAAAPVPWLLDYKMRGITVYDEPGFAERCLGRISLERLDTAWLLGADGFRSGRVFAFVKRVIDIVVSLGMLVLTLPLLIATAFAVRFDSPGPILYSQERVGLGGKTFTVLKFRSMSRDAELGGAPQWAAKQDPRVTRVGAFIRSTRIDELPQLLNVLRGDMSLVGPRPERPHFVAQLTEIIPFYDQRSYVKPGITGWAQVNYPYGASVEDAREKLAYDLYYVKNRGLVLDVLVLLATVRVILFREGAR